MRFKPTKRFRMKFWVVYIGDKNSTRFLVKLMKGKRLGSMFFDSVDILDELKSTVFHM